MAFDFQKAFAHVNKPSLEYVPAPENTHSNSTAIAFGQSFANFRKHRPFKAGCKRLQAHMSRSYRYTLEGIRIRRWSEHYYTPIHLRHSSFGGRFHG